MTDESLGGLFVFFILLVIASWMLGGADNSTATQQITSQNSRAVDPQWKNVASYAQRLENKAAKAEQYFR